MQTRNFLLLSLFSAALSTASMAAPLSIDCVLRGSCMQGKDVVEHLKTLQRIADANNGNRSAGSSGHELSGNFIAQKLLAAGYKVELSPFEFMKFTKISGRFVQAAPSEVIFDEEKDFNVMTYSGAGSVSAKVTAVDVAIGSGNSSTSGCEIEDFANFPAGDIALLQRGTCPFSQKVLNAIKAKAAGAIIFNQGNTSDREGIFVGTLSEDSSITIPALAVPYKLGVEFSKHPDTVLTIETDTKTEKKTSFNVIAESKTGNPENVVMIGAHLDSVAEGPGINDNGSGSAAILEVALKMKSVKSNNKVRFAWFSAEELGLIGSTKYVEGLSELEKNKIALYINVDMVGSPNYKISVFDGDGSKFGQKGPQGSESIEQLFHNFFGSTGVTSVETELNGRSDYAAFSAAGIAVGGIFTGAEGGKTEEEAKHFGGKAGEAYDACYHKACDDINNINVEALELNTNAIAFMALSYGHSTATVRSVNKMATMSRQNNKVVFPKHLHCHEVVYDR